MSKVHARSHEITTKPLRVRAQKNTVTFDLKNISLSVPQMLKTWRIVVNRISKVRQTTCNWIKILDKATRIVSVFHDFILRFEAWVNVIRASSFIKSFPQISSKPVAFQQNLPGKLSRNPPFFTNRFSAKLASKIPAKFPRNRPFCPWKYREIWLFFPRPTRSPD